MTPRGDVESASDRDGSFIGFAHHWSGRKVTLAHPVLGFCPYLPLTSPIAFADWVIGPVQAFDGRWADPRFEMQAKAFLAKFVDGQGKPVVRPSLLCRRDHTI